MNGFPQYDDSMWQGQPSPPQPSHFPQPQATPQRKPTTRRKGKPTTRRKGKAKRIVKNAFLKSIKVSKTQLAVSVTFIISCFLCFMIYQYKHTKKAKTPPKTEKKAIIYKGKQQN